VNELIKKYSPARIDHMHGIAGIQIRKKQHQKNKKGDKSAQPKTCSFQQFIFIRNTVYKDYDRKQD